MVIAWLMAASIGVLMPRYMKRTWVGKQIMKKDRWFIVISITTSNGNEMLNTFFFAMKVSSRTYGSRLDSDRGSIHHHLCRSRRLDLGICFGKSAPTPRLHHYGLVNSVY